MDDERFREAAAQVLGTMPTAGGIGTLGEKSLHAVLKQYLEPDPARQEIRVGRYVADIERDGRITEIQTRNFFALQKKLAAFLPEHPVTVVFPVAAVKWLRWLDPATGETGARRRSPRKGRPSDVFAELCHIREFLTHPNFTLRVLLLELEELRLLDGWSRDRKKGSRRCNRIPLALLDEVTLAAPADYRKLLPAALAPPFTAKELARAGRLSDRAAHSALWVLEGVGTVRRCGKKRNALLYEFGQSESQPPA